jgi:hypothetical protein
MGVTLVTLAINGHETRIFALNGRAWLVSEPGRRAAGYGRIGAAGVRKAARDPWCPAAWPASRARWFYPTRNLELRTRPQPAGIGVSDAVAWAREILARYAGVSGTSNSAQRLFERSWRWRESNPRPSVPHQGFSGRSLLCFSQPRRSRKQVADGLSRCLVSRLAPRPRQAVDPPS